MDRVFVAGPAKLFQLKRASVIYVFGRAVISLTALGALQKNTFAHGDT